MMKIDVPEGGDTIYHVQVAALGVLLPLMFPRLLLPLPLPLLLLPLQLCDCCR